MATVESASRSGLTKSRLQLLGNQPVELAPQLLGIIAIFFAPVVLAYGWFYWMSGSGPDHTINRGELVQGRSLSLELAVVGLDGELTPALAAHKGRWLVVNYGVCTDGCVEMVWQLHNFRLSFSKDVSRIVPVLLLRAGAELPVADGADVTVVGMPEGTSALPQVFDRAGVYVVDPLGNVVLFYAAEWTPAAIKKDMKRLLKLSRLG